MDSYLKLSSGLFRVEYLRGEDLKPELQQPLLAALRAEPPGQALGILFVLGPGVRTVDLSVPSFWLGVTQDRTLKLRALAMVTTAGAVRVAAKGFAMANTLRGLKLEVKTFEAEPAATTWIESALSAA
jgi:hypothetical protein